MESNFHKQFMLIGNSMARKAKKESRQIQEDGNDFIDKLNIEFVKKIKRELFVSTSKFLKNYETSLNQQISDNIQDTNQKILDKKNELFENLKKLLMDIVKKKILENYGKYKEFLKDTLSKRVELFGTGTTIRLNKKDADLFNELASIFDKQGKKLILDNNYLEDFGGFILSSPDINVDESMENIVSKKERQIKQIFGKAFPKYIDVRKSATEMMQEKNINKVLFSIPEELNAFIEEKDVKVIN